MGLRYLFDTYAFYEFVDGSVRYKKYFQDYEVVTTRLNLIELFYALLKDFDFETAQKHYYAFLPSVVEFSDEVVEKAMIFRLKYRNRDLSYVDCIGYVLAQELGLRFLTGDRQFKDLRNVEFVK